MALLYLDGNGPFFHENTEYQKVLI